MILTHPLQRIAPGYLRYTMVPLVILVATILALFPFIMPLREQHTLLELVEAGSPEGAAAILAHWSAPDKIRLAHRAVMPSVVHDTTQYANNRAEVSHQPMRRRERQMQRFKSAGQAQRFLTIHGLIQNLFRVGRHLLRAVNHRLFSEQAFGVWNAVASA